MNRFSTVVHAARRRPLAACVASIFALSPALGFAGTCVVDSCDGDVNSGVPGQGTLRYCIENANDSGDIVDLTGRTGVNACPNSKISLTTGEIFVNHTSLTIIGPGEDVLTIDGSMLPDSSFTSNARPFTHTGSGTFALTDISVSGGHVYHSTSGYPGIGGCIDSLGSVTLTSVHITSCKAGTSNTAPGLGGGVYAKGDLTLTDSTVSGNSVYSLDAGTTAGGGLYAAGNLTLNHSTLSNNSAGSKSDAKGGGAYAKGTTLIQQNSTLTGNSVNSSAGNGFGGGIYAKGDLTLDVSTISGNIGGGIKSKGGGAHVVGHFTSSYSTVSNNDLYGTGYGGGLFLAGKDNRIKTSTISGNGSAGRAGGIDVRSFDTPGSNYFRIVNSTISNNNALTTIGGLYVNSGTAKFYNSTIAFNTAATGSSGVELNATSASIAVTLKSTLMSNNTYGIFQNDLKTFPGIHTITFNGSNLAAQANNLIFVPVVTPAPDVLPTDTIIGNCPHLGKLRDNGGLTQTHALRSKSVAIDAGNDVFGSLYDQRGSQAVNGVLNYTRFSGASALADIGAYEVQQNDIVFNNDLEECPASPI